MYHFPSGFFAILDFIVPVYRSYVELIVAVGPLITLILMLLAVWQFWLSRETRKVLDKVAEATQTRYAGQFPEYMARVIDLVDNAESSVHIACVILTTGVFSHRPSFERYKGTLIRKAADIPINIVCGDHDHRNRFDETQFTRSYKSFEECKQDHQQSVREFLDRWVSDEQPPSPRELTYEALRSQLERLHRDTRDSLCLATIVESKTDFTVWFWIADEMRAILAIPLTKGRLIAHTIETADQGLIQPLLELHKQLSSEALTD